MPDLEVLYDSLQELLWFQSLDVRLASLPGRELTAAPPTNPRLQTALAYDRPDLILTGDGVPILMVERTEEVPSGHNVGQRFARLVAAARAGAVCLYMFPFAARKHGGETAGPRYANMRLFQAMEKVEAVYRTPVLAINWPVDSNYEVLKTPAKDTQVRAIVSCFLTAYLRRAVGDQFVPSEEVAALRRAINEFADTIKRKAVYGAPPPSVRIHSNSEAGRLLSIRTPDLPTTAEVLVYSIGMRYIRSDPYVGTAMLYDYLYARESQTRRRRAVILHCPNISVANWRSEAQKGPRIKTIRLFVEVADLMVFSDSYLTKERLLS